MVAPIVETRAMEESASFVHLHVDSASVFSSIYIPVRLDFRRLNFDCSEEYSARS